MVTVHFYIVFLLSEYKSYHNLLPQLLHFQVLHKSPAPKMPNNPILAAFPMFEILDKLVLPQVGHLGYNIKTNIKFITKLTSVPIK